MKCVHRAVFSNIHAATLEERLTAPDRQANAAFGFHGTVFRAAYTTDGAPSLHIQYEKITNTAYTVEKRKQQPLPLSRQKVDRPVWPSIVWDLVISDHRP